VVPISINNSWKIFKYGFFPLGLGNHLTFTIHKPLSVKDLRFEEVMKQTEQAIVQGIKI
jgi:1-acyl-sn-glycerol-3-phosphate acyltransferase